MDRLLQDLRYALRSFAKSPGFTALALLTIGIGVGVNATVFSLVNALLLRPSPGVPDHGSLVSVFTSDFSSGPYGSSSYPDYVSLKTDASAFRGLAAFREAPVSMMRVAGAMERVRPAAVSDEFFDVLGMRPAAGRLISAADAGSAAPVGVIGYNLWQRSFGGAASAIGAHVTLDGQPLTIVGVAPPRFDGLSLGAQTEVWTRLADRTIPAERSHRWLSIVGRLREGSSLRQAQSQLDAVARRLAIEFPESNRGTLRHPDDPRPITVVSHTRLHPRFRAEVAMVGATIMAAVIVVLLIACANVAGLLLSRATSRSREVAVRLAVGASRGRILRQMLTESVLLGIAGGGAGLLMALWTADTLPSFFPAEQAALLDARVDWAVIGFTAAVSMMSGLLCGLVPAFHGVRSPAAGALRSDAGRTGESRRIVRARNTLVVAQVALASVLLLAGTLLTRSLAKALDADPGFTTRRAVVFSVELPSAFTPDRGVAYYESLVAEVASVPGVEQAGLARVVPAAGGSRTVFSVPGYVPAPGEDMELHVNTVHRDYFATMGMPVFDGRLFEPADAPDAPLIVVNQVFADRYFGGDAVGRRILTFAKQELQIIGVVRAQLRDGLQNAGLPIVFVQLGGDFPRRATVVARTAGDPRPLLDTIRRRATAVDENVAVFRAISLDDHLGEAVAANRLTVALVATCGLMAFTLSVVGVYGIVAYSVVRRTREIGVRVALGARPEQVLALFVRESGRIVVIGVAAGVLVAIGSTRWLASMLYGVSATDAATFLLVPAAIATTALLASCIPAARALRISPVAALRHE
jgi:predicted permease